VVFFGGAVAVVFFGDAVNWLQCCLQVVAGEQARQAIFDERGARIARYVRRETVEVFHSDSGRRIKCVALEQHAMKVKL
jgi:hypothetical protein